VILCYFSDVVILANSFCPCQADDPFFPSFPHPEWGDL
jgi:hypothetical protein